jgi:hypothetical protein
MNGALLGLAVVLAIGVILWAFLFVGGKLIDFALARRHLPPRSRRKLESVEDLVVDFVRHSPDLACVLFILATTNRPNPFGEIVHKIRIAGARPCEAPIVANSAATALSILFVSGLIRLTADGFVATEVGREVQRRIEGAPAQRVDYFGASLSTQA